MSSWRLRSGPAGLRREGHQDGFDIAAGPEAELGASIIKKVEFRVPAAANKLMLAFCIRPGPVHGPSYDVGIGLEECESYSLCEREVGLPIVCVQMVKKNAAGAPRFVAVRQKEI